MKVGDQIIVIHQRGPDEPRVGLVGRVSKISSSHLIQFNKYEFGGHGGKTGQWWCVGGEIEIYHPAEELIDLYYGSRK